ncbi:MAG: hypothetical protein ACXAC7_08940 [Candidatus Hodarchaeales archaeon]
MNSYLIDFEAIKWNNVAPGFRENNYISKNKNLRLVEFSEDLIEENWCLKGHVGYVLEGVLNINFSGKNITLIKEMEILYL